MRQHTALRATVAACIVLGACTGLSGCVQRPAGSAVPRPVAAPVFVPKWCEPLLAREDLGLALAAATQNEPITGAQSALASATVARALTAFAADTNRAAHHNVNPSLVGSATIGSVCVLHDPTVTETQVERPIWNGFGVMEQVRVGVFSGSRFMGEYVVWAGSEGATEAMLVDGSYSLAQRAALVLLWDHFGRRPFRYVVTWDGSVGSWVIGHDGKNTTGVFLGDCRADTSKPSHDSAAAKVIRPGTVLAEPAMAEAFLQSSQAAANMGSIY